MTTEMTSTTERTAEWGHWGITFCTHEVDGAGRRSYAPLSIDGYLGFPVGSRGPIDGPPGSPTRESYRRMIRAWVERGELPAGATKERS